MDPTWPPLQAVIMERGEDAIVKVEPRLVAEAGRGLFTTEQVAPLQTLLSIPGCLLLNARTLSKTYPGCVLSQKYGVQSMHLTSVQLISLHLYRWKRGVPDPTFDAYIKSLPESFHDHPLTVLVLSGSRSDAIESLPASVAATLVEVETRMLNDWSTIVQLLKNMPDLAPPLYDGHNHSSNSELYDFIWAWLNVNTRCIYHNLGMEQSEDNITMCPLLDFANHTPIQSASITQDEFALGDGLAFSSAVHLQTGDEVYLRYGTHSNAVLFAEYGFVFPCPKANAHTGSNEINVDLEVEEMLRSCQDYEEKVRLLRERNYWRNWTLHVDDGVGQPSFRLLPVVRLLHISVLDTANSDLQLWEGTLLGLSEAVSADNESRARDSIVTLCDTIVQRGKIKTLQIQSRAAAIEGGEDMGLLQILRMAKELWGERCFVAELVGKAVTSGVEF